MVDLSEGKADAPMVSEPMDIALAAAGVAGKKLDGSRFQMHEIRKDEIVFIVNANNPVSKLTLQQLSDIHTGRITNWKQVRGKDMPITVYSDALTGGTRAMVKKVVLNNQDDASSVKSLISVSRIADLVPGVAAPAPASAAIVPIRTKASVPPPRIAQADAPSRPANQAHWKEF